MLPNHAFNGNGAVDAGEAIAGGISGAFYSGDDEEDGLDRYVVVTDRGPQAYDIGDRDLDDPDDAFDGEKVFDDPMYPITVYTLTDDAGVVLEESALQLMVPDSSEEGGFRLSTGLPGLDGQEAGVAYDIAMELVAVGDADLYTLWVDAQRQRVDPLIDQSVLWVLAQVKQVF